MTRYILTALLFAASPALAQDVQIAGEMGAARPSSGFADAGAESGTGYGLTLTGRVTPAIGLYLNYTGTTFDMEQREHIPANERWTDHGLSAGVRLYGRTPYPFWRLSPWAEGGLVFHDLAGSFMFGIGSEAETGYEIGAGLDIRVFKTLALILPMIRYRSYAFGVELLGEAADIDVGYLTIGVGLSHTVRW